MSTNPYLLESAGCVYAEVIGKKFVRKYNLASYIADRPDWEKKINHQSLSFDKYATRYKKLDTTTRQLAVVDVKPKKFYISGFASSSISTHFMNDLEGLSLSKSMSGGYSSYYYAVITEDNPQTKLSPNYRKVVQNLSEIDWNHSGIIEAYSVRIKAPRYDYIIR
jgi:hypothetical protein